MEVMQKNGFKQTEVGMIPEDWEVVSLSDAVDFLDGQRRPIKSNERISGEYPYYGASGIIDYVNDYIFDDELILLGEDGENIISRNLPLAFIIKGKAWVNNHAHVIKPKFNFNINFLAEYLESLDYSLLNSGTAQPKLNKKSCFGIKVIKPTLAEQAAIATALSDVDNLIANLDQLITKKKDMKQGAMQQLLMGFTRLSEFGQSGKLKNTEIGFISEDWSVEILNSLCHFENGDRGFNYPSKSDFKSWGKMFVNTGHLQNKGISLTSMDYISDEKYYQLNGGKFKIGDILFCLRGSLGKFGVIKTDSLIGAIASSLIIIRPIKGKISSSYLEFYFESKYCKNMIDLLAGGAAQPNLGGSDLGLFKIPIPPSIEEQDAITQILSDMDAEINQLETKKAKYQGIKQGMMQELLTGKTRLV